MFLKHFASERLLGQHSTAQHSRTAQSQRCCQQRCFAELTAYNPDYSLVCCSPWMQQRSGERWTPLRDAACCGKWKSLTRAYQGNRDKDTQTKSYHRAPACCPTASGSSLAKGFPEMSARMEKYLVADSCPSAAAVASSRLPTAQGEPLCPHGSSSPGSWLAAEKGWSRRKGTASCSNTKAGKTGSLAFSACRAGWRPSPHKGSIRGTPAPRRLAVLEPSKAADCGGNARSNPSGKAAVSVGVQAPAWTFFKGSQL